MWSTYGGAALHVVLSHGLPVVHCVESGNFIDTHGRHLEDAGDFVHDADAGETVLALAEVEKGHDGGLFVLWWVAGEDFLDEFLVDGVELEGDREVVFGTVAVLLVGGVLVGCLSCSLLLLGFLFFLFLFRIFSGCILDAFGGRRTTWIVSLWVLGVEAKAR